MGIPVADQCIILVNARNLADLDSADNSPMDSILHTVETIQKQRIKEKEISIQTIKL